MLSDLLCAGTIEYPHLLAVHKAGDPEPFLIVSSEVNTAPGSENVGSHVLGLFPGDGHVHLGASDDWADLDRFCDKALEVASEHLGLVGEWKRL